jgi:hypothetical protein
MKTITKAHEAIQQAADTADHDTRVIDRIAVGEHVRQGDLYLLRIDRVDAAWRPTENRQLAPGISTGSRHMADGEGLTLRVSPESNPVDRSGPVLRLLGPQIHADQAFTVTHPEHAHMHMPPGDYQVLYQLDFQRQKAVRD